MQRMLNRARLYASLALLLLSACSPAGYEQDTYPLPPATQALATLLARGVATSDHPEYPPPIPGPLAPPPATITPEAQNDPYPPQADDPAINNPIAVQTARGFLAGRLSLPVRQVQLISWKEASWITPNLGCQPSAVFDLQNPIPGYLIRLRAGEQKYELHSDLSGDNLCQAEPLQPGERLPLAMNLSPSETAELAQLHLASRLGEPVETVHVESQEAELWADGNFDCPSLSGQQPEPAPGGTTPGYRIVLSAQGSLYEYHSGSYWIVYCGEVE